MRIVTILTAVLAASATTFIGNEPGSLSESSIASAASAPQDEKPASTGPTLEHIRKMVGAWYAADDDGKPTDQLMSTYRVTAGGSAIVEVLFPGQNHEMMSVYHMDGGDLVMTHYCALGNQPRYRARWGKNDKQIVWDFRGAGNMHSEKEAHMHDGVVDILGTDRYFAKWHQHKDGEVVYTAEMNVVRKTASEKTK